MMDKPKLIWHECSFCNTKYNEENMTKITYEEPHIEPHLCISNSINKIEEEQNESENDN